LRGRGIACDVHYLNLAFAAEVGWELNDRLCEMRGRFAGEWIFSRAAFGEMVPPSAAYLDAFPTDVAALTAHLGCDAATLTRLRDDVAPAFIDRCLEAVPWQNYDVVGFGSMFQQICAALALARRLKEHYPHLRTVFGGSNFEGEMGLELVRANPAIDYAVIGEGDETFPALLERLAAGEESLAMPGVA